MIRIQCFLAMILVFSSCKTSDRSRISDLESGKSKVTLDVNDVSILFPLPDSRHLGDLLNFSSQGIGGNIFSAKLFQNFMEVSEWKDLPAGQIDPNEIYPEMHITSVRIDPCSLKITDDKSHCLPQIRLIAQHFTTSEDGIVDVSDAALHIIYSLSSQELIKIGEDLKDLKSMFPDKTSGVGLRIQPDLAIDPEGSGGRYGSELKRIILNYIGEQKIAFVAFMHVDGPAQNIWRFGALTHINGKLEPQALKNIVHKVSSFDNVESVRLIVAKSSLSDTPIPGQPVPVAPIAKAGINNNGVIAPESAAKDNTSYFLKSKNFEAIDETKNRLGTLLRIENPKLNDITTVDCVSCHSVTHSKAIARTWGFDEMLSQYDNDRYTPPEGPTFSKRVWQGADAHKANYVTLNFGYFEGQAAISQRTVNESVEAVKAMNHQ